MSNYSEKINKMRMKSHGDRMTLAELLKNAGMSREDAVLELIKTGYDKGLSELITSHVFDKKIHLEEEKLKVLTTKVFVFSGMAAFFGLLSGNEDVFMYIFILALGISFSIGGYRVLSIKIKKYRQIQKFNKFSNN